MFVAARDDDRFVAEREDFEFVFPRVVRHHGVAGYVNIDITRDDCCRSMNVHTPGDKLEPLVTVCVTKQCDGCFW